LNTLVTLQQKSGGCEAGSTACSEAADKIEGLLRTRRQDVLDTTELLAVAITGDPNFYPGLSAPAIEALGRFFAHSHGTKSFGKMVALAIWECLPESKATALDDYWRLQPILEGVAAFMAHISDKKKGDKFGVPTWAVLPVAEAPVAALAGPLRTWVDVVALALDNDNLTGSERSFLYQRIKADRNDPAFAHAFAPIIERLQHKM
jgi:hypothetical protein